MLIAADERPTIEKVRQKLGSGSPNTVSPMLDSWFKTLPGRLEVKIPTEEEARYRMPAEVVAAAKALWDTARKEASDLARDAVAAQRRQLDRQPRLWPSPRTNSEGSRPRSPTCRRRWKLRC